MMQNQSMALMFYNADCIKTFEKWQDKQIKELAQEVSELSLFAPLHDKLPNATWAKAEKTIKLKLLKWEGDHFKIKGIDKKYSPLFLMAVLEYAVNRLSGGQISDKEGFEHLKMAEVLVR